MGGDKRYIICVCTVSVLNIDKNMYTYLYECTYIHYPDGFNGFLM
jgi:hypothetical protein